MIGAGSIYFILFGVSTILISMLSLHTTSSTDNTYLYSLIGLGAAYILLGGGLAYHSTTGASDIPLSALYVSIVLSLGCISVSSLRFGAISDLNSEDGKVLKMSVAAQKTLNYGLVSASSLTLLMSAGLAVYLYNKNVPSGVPTGLPSGLPSGVPNLPPTGMIEMVPLL